MTDTRLPRLSERERSVSAEAGIAVYADRLILDAQPPADDSVLAAIAERCAGPLPAPLIDLWRTAFGGSLCYDLSVALGGHDVALSLRELFHPGSDGYQDLWGWIDHEQELAGTERLSHLPIGGFEYLDRVYVATAPGPGHGSVVAWQQGLPAGWELTEGDRAAPVAPDLPALFAQLVLENDPWQVDSGDGTQLRDAVDELAGSGDPPARSAAATLRRLVQATVLDWRAALAAGTLAGQRRLRHLALQRAAADDDLALMQVLVAQGCDPAEPVRGGYTPIDVALTGRGLTVVRWLLERRVPVDHTLRVGARAVDPALAEELLRRGASVDASAVSSAADNNDERVVDLMSRALRPDADRPAWLLARLRTRAAQATAAGERRRAAVLTEVADRLAGHGQG